MAHILIVDDEISIRHSLEKFLKTLNHQVLCAADGEEALALLEKQAIDLALIDLVMPKVDGLSLIRRMQVIAPDTIPIVLTGFGTITSAVEAMKCGAYHYLTKPFELEDIASIVQTALNHHQLKKENIALKRELHEKYRFENIVGKSEAMQSLFSLIEKVSETDSTVLILGESGTGKELVAKAIHYNSPRKEKPLITVNCAAIPEELLESELFGHMKGSFTGAYATTEGKFAAAHQGTIFLDEIGDMSQKLQVKLLRVLQERKFEPVGATQPCEVDVRILAATNQNLEEGVKHGRFREDLFYRLNVIPILIPALREHPEDIPLLLTHFITKFARAHQKNISGMTEQAKRVLCGYPWPGNVRELENTLERIIILKGKGPLDLKDIPAKIRGEVPSRQITTPIHIPDTGLSFKHALSIFEDSLIIKALQKTGWNKNQAATLLKLNRTTLVEKIKKKGLEKIISKQGG